MNTCDFKKEGHTMLWQDKFELGIPLIDEQHKTLVGYIETTKELIQDAEDGIDCYDEIARVLGELESYTVEHFKEEEALMKKFNYQNLNQHAMEHANFVAKVHVFLETDIDENQIPVLEEMVVFLLDWLVGHILNSDKKYASIMV
jgi:hemerythrin